MNPKQLKKLKKQVKKAHQVVKKQPYIEQLMTYRDLFDDFPQIKFLINNVLESDRLIKNGLLPQPLPKLLLPDNIQDIIFKKVNEQYPQGNPEGDRLWNRYVDALPKLDRLLQLSRLSGSNLWHGPRQRTLLHFQNTCMDGQRLRLAGNAIFPAA